MISIILIPFFKMFIYLLLYTLYSQLQLTRRIISGREEFAMIMCHMFVTVNIDGYGDFSHFVDIKGSY